TGDGMMVAAYAHDNSIEAIEHRAKSWGVRLHWHPEEGSANADPRQVLFEAVVRHANRQKDQKLTLLQERDVGMLKDRRSCFGAPFKMVSLGTLIWGDWLLTITSWMAEAKIVSVKSLRG